MSKTELWDNMRLMPVLAAAYLPEVENKAE
jgi:hypothetical protein